MKKRIFCLVMALCLLAGLFTACGGGKPEAAGEALFAERGSVERRSLENLVPAGNAEAVRASLSAVGQTLAPDWAGEAEAAPRLRLAADPGPDEDTVATDGAYIYMLDSYGLIVCSAAGAASEILSYTRVDRGGSGWSERLYVEGDRAAVVSAVSELGEDGEVLYNDAETRVILLDLADRRAPRVLTETAVEGSLTEACLLDGTLCLVAQRTLAALPEQDEALLPRLWEDGKELQLAPGDVYISPEPARTALTVAAAVRLSDGRIADALAFTDGVDAVRVAGDCLWLARTVWSETASAPRQEAPYTVVDYDTAARTELRKLRLENDQLRLEGGCVLEGALPDPSAMELLGSGLGLFTQKDSRSFSSFTDEKHGWTNYELHSLNRSAALSLLDRELQLSGALTALGGEQNAGSCRFAGGLAWITAGDAAAVYLTDLSDPARPTPSGSLSCPGETLLLREFGEGFVLGIAEPGEGEDWELAVYDVTNPAAPVKAAGLRLEGKAPAASLTDPGAFFTDPVNGLIGFPIAGKNGNEYLLAAWDGSKLRTNGTFRPEYVPADARTLLLDGILYVCSPGELCVTDPETMKVLATVTNAVG